MFPAMPDIEFGWPASWDWQIDERISSAIGAVGGAAAILLFLSPISTFAGIIKDKTTKEFSAFPYVISLIQCELWVAYCFLTPHMQSTPLYTNMFGILLEAVYVAVFLAFASPSSRRRTTALLVSMSIGVAAYVYGTLVIFPGAPARSAAIGAVGDVFNVVMYSAPLGVMGEVIRTKSVACMPLALSVAGLFCGSVWLAFAIYVRNVIVFLPNVCGVVLGIVQLALYAAYRNGPGPPLTADDDAAAAASKDALKEPLLQRSTSAGGGLYEDTPESYSLLLGVGGGGGGGGAGGSRPAVTPQQEAADRVAAEALAAAALAWKGADRQRSPARAAARPDAAV